MRIWTIQPAELYERLRAKKVLFADGRRYDRDRVWVFSYRWMADQMHSRLPPSKAQFPWWGWYRWLGKKRAKPDLRAGGHLPKGRRGVRLELDMDERGVLLSDFSRWHAVLNNSFLAYDEAEDDDFRRKENGTQFTLSGARTRHLQSKVIASWDRIFDLRRLDSDWWGRTSQMAIQATFWELRLTDVRNVTFYTDRGR
ncbi:MAG: DUF3841 domain-containing protein [Solirubrobacterales bacterium]